MKLFIVTAIVVFTNVHRVFSEASIVRSAPEEQESPIATGADSSLTKKMLHPSGMLRRSKCKARNACVVMGGHCVTNSTLCDGRLVPEGCKGLNCQCCVPGTLESLIHNLETELNFIKHNFTSGNSAIEMKLDSLQNNLTNSDSEIKEELNFIRHNITIGNTDLEMKLNSLQNNLTNSDSEIKEELHSLKDNITASFNQQGLKLEVIRERIGCPLGFITPEGSNQCFKIFRDTTRTWEQAKRKCQDEGLSLARPAAAITVYLREELLRIYGDRSWSWVDARGNGSKMMWQHGMTEFTYTSLLHNSISTPVSTSKCLLLLVGTADRNNKPNGPYDDHSCTSTSYYALCEA